MEARRGQALVVARVRLAQTVLCLIVPVVPLVFVLVSVCVLKLLTNVFGFVRWQILDEAIQTRWKILPHDQRDGIKTYVVGKIIQVCFP